MDRRVKPGGGEKEEATAIAMIAELPNS